MLTKELEICKPSPFPGLWNQEVNKIYILETGTRNST